MFLQMLPQSICCGVMHQLNGFEDGVHPQVFDLLRVACLCMQGCIDTWLRQKASCPVCNRDCT